MPSAEFTEWIAYSRVQPFGPRIDDWYHARTQTVIANYAEANFYADKKTRTRKTYQPKDFMMHKPKTQRQKSDALRAGLSALSRKVKK